MRRRLMSAALAAAGLAFLAASVAPEARAEKIEAGAVGGPTATMWLFYVGFDEGFFKKHNVDLDIIFAPTAPGILQQLTAGSLDIVATTGDATVTFDGPDLSFEAKGNITIVSRQGDVIIKGGPNVKINST